MLKHEYRDWRDGSGLKGTCHVIMRDKLGSLYMFITPTSSTRDGDRRIARVCRMPAELEKTKMYIQGEILPQKTRRKMVERIPSVLFCLQVYSQVFMCTCPCMHTCRSEQMNQYMNTKNRRKTKAYSKLPEASRERQGRLSLSLRKKASAGQQLQTSHSTVLQRPHSVKLLSAQVLCDGCIRAGCTLSFWYMSLRLLLSTKSLCQSAECRGFVQIASGHDHLVRFMLPSLWGQFLSKSARPKHSGKKVCYKCSHSPLGSQVQTWLWP